MAIPRTLSELEDLVRNQVEESVHLDYKESSTFAKGIEAIRKDLAKDVSSFANADGGTLVYGMVEENRLPIRLDGGTADADWTAERIENIAISNIAPRLNDFEVVQIRTTNARSYYVLAVGKSFRGPHQSTIERS